MFYDTGSSSMDYSNRMTSLCGICSPVRIIRDENYQSNVRGLIPAGEGAGYAGGITSAAIDGIKIFEFIGKNFHKPEDFC